MMNRTAIDPLSSEAQVAELMHQERWEAAVNLIGDVAVEVRSGKLNWNHGWALFRLGRFTEAAQAFRRSALQDPSNRALSHWALGVVLREAGDLAPAEAHLLKALSIQDSGLARLNLAVLYMAQRRFEDAERVHLEGLRLKPTNRERLEAYADFLDDTARETEANEVRARASTLPRRRKTRRREADDD